MRNYLFLLMVIAIISCTNSNEASEQQQKKIDSLTNAIKQKDDVITKENETKVIKEKGSIEERNSLIKLVYTDKPSFTALSLGGYKDIRFNLFNDSKYNLDQVILKVHYVKANGIEVKTETKILSDIAPKSHTVLSAPDYIPAGKDLTVTIETILCKEIDLCYYYSPIDSITSNDPYKCRQ
jgi:hypothetical protein